MEGVVFYSSILQLVRKRKFMDTLDVVNIL